MAAKKSETAKKPETQGEKKLSRRGRVEGGARPNAGRPKGGMQALTRKAREEAQALGMLPHEWLLAIMRGEPIAQKYWADHESGIRVLQEEMVYPDLEMRIEAAKAAAPYYAPKLARMNLSSESDDEFAREVAAAAEKARAKLLQAIEPSAEEPASKLTH